MGTFERGTAFLARQHATSVFTVTWSPGDMCITPASWKKTMLIGNIEPPHNGPGDSNGDSATMTPYRPGGNYQAAPLHLSWTPGCRRCREVVSHGKPIASVIDGVQAWQAS